MNYEEGDEGEEDGDRCLFVVGGERIRLGSIDLRLQFSRDVADRCADDLWLSIL